MTEPSIVLVADAAFESRLRAAVPSLNGNLHRWDGGSGETRLERVVDDMIASEPSIVAFGPELPLESVLLMAAEIDRQQPDVEVLVVAEPTHSLWERAARAGIREIVSPVAGDDALRAAVERTMSTVVSRGLRPPRGVDAPPAGGAHRALVVVRSPKGGSGKTFVASNVAVSLARQHPGEVVVVDLDLQFGDMASALGIEPSYTIADATANIDLTPTALKALLSTHESSLYALCGPPTPEESDVITAADVDAVLALLQEAFRYVVVDTGAGFDRWTSVAMDRATDMVLVCSMDVSSVRALRKDILTLPETAEGGARRHVVLNRANSRVALELREVEAALGTAVDVQVPSARCVPLHMNCGLAVVDAEPSSAVARQVAQLVERVAPEPAVARPAGRSLRRRR
jgi:pilus assembly protein CpaE